MHCSGLSNRCAARPPAREDMLHDLPRKHGQKQRRSVQGDARPDGWLERPSRGVPAPSNLLPGASSPNFVCPASATVIVLLGGEALLVPHSLIACEVIIRVVSGKTRLSWCSYWQRES